MSLQKHAHGRHQAENLQNHAHGFHGDQKRLRVAHPFLLNANGRIMRRAHGFLDARAVLFVFLIISGLECVWCVGRVQAVDFLVLCGWSLVPCDLFLRTTWNVHRIVAHDFLFFFICFCMFRQFKNNGPIWSGLGPKMVDNWQHDSMGLAGGLSLRMQTHQLQRDWATHQMQISTYKQN